VFQMLCSTYLYQGKACGNCKKTTWFLPSNTWVSWSNNFQNMLGGFFLHEISKNHQCQTCPNLPQPWPNFAVFQRYIQPVTSHAGQLGEASPVHRDLRPCRQWQEHHHRPLDL
jgi:hypothetical protein